MRRCARCGAQRNIASRSNDSIRLEGATHRATGRRGVMKTFELLSIIGSIFAVGIMLGAVVIASNANLHAELRNARYAGA